MANKSIKHWQDPVNLVLGLWLVISPWVLGYPSEAVSTASAVVLGILIAAAAILTLYRLKAWEEWVSFALGLIVIASPWILRFTTSNATWNAVATGLVVAVMALWTLGTDKNIGGWWSRSPAV
jgi:SPW repeat